MVLLSRCRSWDTTSTAPSKSCSARVSARRISRSRWLVGSSSSSRLGLPQAIAPAPGAPSRHRRSSTPARRNDRCGNRSRRGNRAGSLALVGGDALQVQQRAGLGVERVELMLGEVADHQVLAALQAAAEGRKLAGERLDQVDLPAPLGPSRPIRAPGTSCSLTLSRTSLSP